MFETISLEDSGTGGEPIDPGFLAECLIFYKRVIVCGNRVVLQSLLRTVGPDNLLDLLKSRSLEYHFKEEQTGVSTGTRSGREYHVLIKLSSPDHTLEKDVAEALSIAITGGASSTHKAEKLASLVVKGDLHHFDLNDVMLSLAESRYVQQSVEAILSVYAPRYLLSAKPRFRVHQDPQGLVVETNLDFERLNREYHLTIPSTHSSLSSAQLLATIMGAQESLALAARLGSELGGTAVGARIHSLHLAEIVRRRAHSFDQIGALSNLTLDGAFAIRDAVNSGRVSFSQIRELVEKAERFKTWLDGQSPDRELIKAYYEAVIKETWVDKLPAKSVRWGVFTAAGLALDAATGGVGGTIAGVGLSIVDSFFLDKLVKGWRPHHFIEEDLNPMLRGEATK